VSQSTHVSDLKPHFNPQSQLLLPLACPRPQEPVGLEDLIFAGWRLNVAAYQLPQGLAVLKDDLVVADEPVKPDDRAKRGGLLCQLPGNKNFRYNRDLYHVLRQEGLIGTKTAAESEELGEIRIEVIDLMRLAWILQGGPSLDDIQYVARVGDIMTRLRGGVSKERIAAFEMVSRSGSITDRLKRRNAGRLPLYHGSAIKNLDRKINRYRQAFDRCGARTKVLLLVEADHVAVFERIGRLAGQAWRSDQQTGPKSKQQKREKLASLLTDAAELCQQAIFARPFVHAGDYLRDDLIIAATAITVGEWMECRRRLSVIERSCYLITALRREVERVRTAISEAQHLELTLNHAECARLGRDVASVVRHGFKRYYDTPDNEQLLGHQFRGAVAVERMSLDLNQAAEAITDNRVAEANQHFANFDRRV
jgi:hypothetical protein